MKKAIQLFLLLFLMSSVGKTQTIINLSIVPANPTESDSIFLISHLSLVLEEMNDTFDNETISYEMNEQNNLITLICSQSYDIQAGIFLQYSYIDTVYLGNLNSGSYVLHYQLQELYPNNEPEPYTVGTDFISFTVDESPEYICDSTIIEQNIPLSLSQGWNMIDYTCVEPLNVIEAFSTVEDKIIIVKDNLGNSYLPDWEFNGIGDLEFAKGYQLKITEDISDFYFCPTLIYSE